MLNCVRATISKCEWNSNRDTPIVQCCHFIPDRLQYTYRQIVKEFLCMSMAILNLDRPALFQHFFLSLYRSSHVRDLRCSVCHCLGRYTILALVVGAVPPPAQIFLLSTWVRSFFIDFCICIGRLYPGASLLDVGNIS